MRINHFLLIVFATIMFVTILLVRYQPGLINFRNDRIAIIEDNANHTGNTELKRLKQYGKQLKKYARKNKYNTSVCFLVDMKLHSGKKRFFIFNLLKDTVISSGLMAHGSCNYGFLVNAKFSNSQGCGCTSVGRYVVGNKYNGRFGTAFKLSGLDTSNNNAFRRAVVLHAYDCVPDKETYPAPVCNSLGCPMVSYSFLATLQKEIKLADKPVLLWIFN